MRPHEEKVVTKRNLLHPLLFAKVIFGLSRLRGAGIFQTGGVANGFRHNSNWSKAAVTTKNLESLLTFCHSIDTYKRIVIPFSLLHNFVEARMAHKPADGGGRCMADAIML